LACILEIKRQHQHPLEHLLSSLCATYECGYKFYAIITEAQKTLSVLFN